MTTFCETQQAGRPVKQNLACKFKYIGNVSRQIEKKDQIVGTNIDA